MRILGLEITRVKKQEKSASKPKYRVKLEDLEKRRPTIYTRDGYPTQNDPRPLGYALSAAQVVVRGGEFRSENVWSLLRFYLLGEQAKIEERFTPTEIEKIRAFVNSKLNPSEDKPRPKAILYNTPCERGCKSQVPVIRNTNEGFWVCPFGHGKYEITEKGWVRSDKRHLGARFSEGHTGRTSSDIGGGK